MPESDFIAKNPLEQLLVKTQSGLLPFAEFLAAFMEATVFLPSNSEIKSDGSGFTPMLFDKFGELLMCVFTASDRINGFAEFCLAVKGHRLLSCLRRYGIVVNPGYHVGFEIPAERIKDICREFALGEEEEKGKGKWWKEIWERWRKH